MATNGSTMEALAVATAVPVGPGTTNQDGARGGAARARGGASNNDENVENTNVMGMRGGQQRGNDDDDDDDDNNVPMATSAVPVFPPRPDAFVTLLTTEDHLPGAQTMLYSLKKQLLTKTRYPPELVVLATPNIADQVREALCPSFCTRVLEVEPLSFPKDSLHLKQHVAPHVKGWAVQGTLTKLHVFRLDQYDTIVYIDADCLVVKDVYHLVELGKVYQESDALIAAAPDLMPPDKFNAGVMVLRPSQTVFDNMMGQRRLLTTYDGGDTGFLNAYFPEWYTQMPPMARLSFGYNAQRLLYSTTYEKQPNYWDLGVAPDLHIIHFSSQPKPWESKPPSANEATESSVSTDTAVAESHLDQDDVKKLKKVQKAQELDNLWWGAYQRSKNFASSFAKEAQEDSIHQKKRIAEARKVSKELKRPKTPQEIHKLVSKRFKDLRKEGKSVKDAMRQARIEYGQDKEDDDEAGSSTQRVAAMFGIA